jgi:hypothetical protein
LESLTHGWDPGREPFPVAQILASELLSVGDCNPDQRDVRALVDSLAPGDRYWSQLEAPFKELVVHLRLGHEPTLMLWGHFYDAARSAFRSTARGIEANARANRAVAQAERRFNTMLRERLGDLAPASAIPPVLTEEQHAAI